MASLYFPFPNRLLILAKNIPRRFFSKKLIPDVKDENFRLLFLGNDNFSIASLQAIGEVIHSKKCLSVVVSNRNNIVGKYAHEHEIRTFLWNDLKAGDNTEVFNIGVVASFGHLIPKRVIEKCDLGILNVHGSLLPKYRGAAPIARAICNGEEETGISIMKIAPHKFDVGPILIRKKCKIHPHVRAPELTKIMAQIGGQALKQALLNLSKSLDTSDVQEDGEATLAPKLTSDLAQVNWEKLKANEVYNLFRGLSGFSKLYTYYNGRKVDLDEIGLVGCEEVDNSHDEESRLKDMSEDTDFSKFYSYPVYVILSNRHKVWKDVCVPGQMVIDKNLVLICCADNRWIFSRRIKISSKWMTANDFKNGYISKSKGTQVFLYSQENSNVNTNNVLSINVK